MDEIIVTALGSVKENRSIGYAVQSVDSESITNANETNIVNALQGQIAGVQIQGSPSTLGGSSRITIRGSNSFLGNNQPLFVVDGVPINKTFQVSIKYEIPREASFDEVTVAPLLEGCEELEGNESRDCFENGVTKHISENFKYPRKALKNQIEGDVFIQFEITKSGYFINFTTIGPNKILEDEAYRIMSRLPQVQPGEYLGKKVSSSSTVSISSEFELKLYSTQRALKLAPIVSRVLHRVP